MLSKIHYSPWNNLPACFLGLFLAHFYFELTQKKEKVEDDNWNGLDSGEIKDGIEKNGVGKSNGHNRTNTLAGHAKSGWKPYAQKIGHYVSMICIWQTLVKRRLTGASCSSLTNPST